jgi:hypothetical protein
VTVLLITQRPSLPNARCAELKNVHCIVDGSSVDGSSIEIK